MKLTILRLTALGEQDRIDLGKTWPNTDPAELTLNDTHRLYAARFNDRLLGAVQVILRGERAQLAALCVREVTRRRGVGQYLLEETMRGNADIHGWYMEKRGIEDAAAMDAFMQALGFVKSENGWVKQRGE